MVHGPRVEEEIWRIRTDRELRELYKELDIVVDIKKKRLESTGHVVRMDQERTVNPLNTELNPICHLLALLGAHHILHVNRIRVEVENEHRERDKV